MHSNRPAAEQKILIDLKKRLSQSQKRLFNPSFPPDPAEELIPSFTLVTNSHTEFLKRIKDYENFIQMLLEKYSNNESFYYSTLIEKVGNELLDRVDDFNNNGLISCPPQRYIPLELLAFDDEVLTCLKDIVINNGVMQNTEEQLLAAVLDRAYVEKRLYRNITDISDPLYTDSICAPAFHILNNLLKTYKRAVQQPENASGWEDFSRAHKDLCCLPNINRIEAVLLSVPIMLLGIAATIVSSTVFLFFSLMCAGSCGSIRECIPYQGAKKTSKSLYYTAKLNNTVKDITKVNMNFFKNVNKDEGQSLNSLKISDKEFKGRHEFSK